MIAKEERTLSTASHPTKNEATINHESTTTEPLLKNGQQPKPFGGGGWGGHKYMFSVVVKTRHQNENKTHSPQLEHIQVKQPSPLINKIQPHHKTKTKHLALHNVCSKK